MSLFVLFMFLLMEASLSTCKFLVPVNGAVVAAQVGCRALNIPDVDEMMMFSLDLPDVKHKQSCTIMLVLLPHQ